MKKTISFLAVIAAFFAFNCCSRVEVSPEMQGFMDEIEVTNSIVEAAEKYGYNANEMPLEHYELIEASISKAEKSGDKTLYYTNFKHGIIDSEVVIIWQDKLIVKIKEIE